MYRYNNKKHIPQLSLEEISIDQMFLILMLYRAKYVHGLIYQILFPSHYVLYDCAKDSVDNVHKSDHLL
jgi:hypothetical protein